MIYVNYSCIYRWIRMDNHYWHIKTLLVYVNVGNSLIIIVILLQKNVSTTASLWWASFGVSFVRIFEKIDRVITAAPCIYYQWLDKYCNTNNDIHWMVWNILWFWMFKDLCNTLMKTPWHENIFSITGLLYFSMYIGRNFTDDIIHFLLWALMYLDWQFT